MEKIVNPGMGTTMDTEKLRHLLQGNQLPKSPSVRIFSPACVMMPLFEKNDEAHILAVLKADTKGYPWRNQVALPGGHVDASDDTTMSAAYRELREELNISPKNIEMVGSLGYFQTLRQIEIEAFVGFWNGSPDEVRFDPREISTILEVRLADLIKTHLENQYQGPRPGVANLIYPTGRSSGNGQIVIWGVTAMIIHFFLEHLLKLSPEVFATAS